MVNECRTGFFEVFQFDAVRHWVTRVDEVERVDAAAGAGRRQANDALRGIKPEVTRANLDKILRTLAAKGISVLIAGMKAPGNWGPDYVKSFDAIFPELTAKYNTALYPFFLEGVAFHPSLVLSDGLHPTGAGVAETVKRILPEAEALVLRAIAHKAAAKN